MESIPMDLSCSPCAHCGNQDEGSKRCSRCKSVYYCSVDCQKKHWSAHKVNCNNLDNNDQEMKKTPQCNNCKKISFGSKKCLGCKSVYYCSKQCQVEAWKEHKQYCLQRQRKHSFLKSPDMMLYGLFTKCTFCGNVITNPIVITHCPQCLKAAYCSRYCLANDWSIHESICENSNSEADYADKQSGDIGEQAPDVPPGQKCSLCGSLDNLKTCSDCKSVFYCSKMCQKSDWKNHKTICKKISGNYNQDTMKKKIEAEKKLRDMRIQNIEDLVEFDRSKKYKHTLVTGSYDSTALHYDDNADITIVKRPGPNSWEQAMTNATFEYPKYHIITSMAQVPREGTLVFKSYMLVAFIPRYHHYRGRHCVFVEDLRGHELYIAFYFKSREFDWSQIKPGRFIYIKHPRIHHFQDSSVGFKLENPSDFRIDGY